MLRATARFVDQIVADQVSFTGGANLTHNCTGVGVSDPVTNSGPVKIAE